MSEDLATMLAVGGKSNSLGRVDEVIALVEADPSRVEELYGCLFDNDAWTRMRAADALEKICRRHPDWLLPFVDRFPRELGTSDQPSIQWHLAQIYGQVELTSGQRSSAIAWLCRLLSNREADWIVAAQAMNTLSKFTRDGFFPWSELVPLLQIQKMHRSAAVVKRANKLRAEFDARDSRI
jgi:hypothetical protein